MKELDQKVHRQLAASEGAAIEAMVPPLNVVVGTNCMSEYCPVCWAPSGSINPRARHILCEHWLYFCFWEKGQGHDLSDEDVRSAVVVVCGLKGEVLHLVNKEERIYKGPFKRS